jgi:hypothetical protein
MQVWSVVAGKPPPVPRSPFEPVGHRDQDVLTAPRLQVGEHLHPEFGAFRLLDPDAQDVAGPVRQYRQGQRDGFAPHHGLIADLDAEGIEEDHRIQRLERPALPRRHFRNHGIGDRADQIRRDVHGIHLFQERLNLADRQAARRQRDDLVVEAREAPLVFPDQLWLERALAIARHLD